MGVFRANAKNEGSKVNYKSVFPNKQSLLVVVHIANNEQAIRNVGVAMMGGADGVFLIDHGGYSEIDTARAVHEAFPDVWLGINRLGCSLVRAFDELSSYIRGVWTDTAAIDERFDDQVEAHLTQINRVKASWSGLYFGGVAFKYQRPVEDLEMAAKKAAPYMDVLCTSGPGTGRAADEEKIRRLCAASTIPVAIASGVTPENVDLYPEASCFLVATGISRSFHELDPDKVKALAGKLRK